MNIFKLKIKVLIGVFLAGVFLGPLSGQTADEILEKADDIFDMESMYQKSTMIITRNGRTQPEQIMESWYLDEGGKNMSLMVFLAPARVKGTAYLTLDDDLWVRFGSTGRVRKLSSSAKKNSAAEAIFPIPIWEGKMTAILINTGRFFPGQKS